MGNAVEPIGRMPPYGPEHLTILALTVVLSIAVVLVGRRIRGTDLENRVLRTGGWIMLTVTIAWTVWGMLPGNWNIAPSRCPVIILTRYG